MKKIHILLLLFLSTMLVACKDKDKPKVELPASANSFIQLVEKLGDISLDSKDALNSTRQFYLILDEEVKELKAVKDSYAILESKINEYLVLYQTEFDRLNDEKIITEFNKVVSSLPETKFITLDDSKNIQNAFAIYQEISETGKTNVAITYQKLLEADSRYNQLVTLDDANYQKVYFIAKTNIKYLDVNELTLKDKEAIERLDLLYATLNTEFKTEADVKDAHNKLKELTSVMTQLAKEQEIIEIFLSKVYALPTADELRYQNQAQKQAMMDCFNYYETLTENQKSQTLVVKAYNDLQNTFETFNNLKEPYDINLCNFISFVNNYNNQSTPVEAFKRRYGYTDETLKENMTIYFNFYIEGGAKPGNPFYKLDITNKKTISLYDVEKILKELSTQEGYEMVTSGEHYCFTYNIVSKNDAYASSYYSDFFSRMVISF